MNHILSSGFLFRFMARKKGDSGFFISSGRWPANFRYRWTGQRSFPVACAFGLKALLWPSPCRVFEPFSSFHTSTCLPVRGSFSSPTSPHWSFQLSSLARKPKCKESTHHTVRCRTSGSCSPNWPVLNSQFAGSLRAISFRVVNDQVSFAGWENLSGLWKLLVFQGIYGWISVV